MNNVFTATGYGTFIRFLSKEGQSKISLQKVVKQI